ncbi:MAG: S-layer homology domain-containing protein [Peptococcaceae bacterium]|nr:S-layer homology domain-containing protein [Peptococcaceae bacterium]
MHKPLRKSLAALLTLAMLVSLLPISAAPAQAAGEGESHDISTSTLTISEDGNYTVTGTTTTNQIVVKENVTATVTLNSVNITGAAGNSATGAPAQSPIDLATGATLTLILAENSTNTLTGGAGTGYCGAPGIHVPDDAALIIQGGGSLTVTGGSYKPGYGAPGIGGTTDNSGAESGSYTGEDCGTVIILSSGNLSVKGGTGESTATDIGGGSGTQKGDDGQGIRPVSGQENTYMVWGDLELPCDITIPQDATVTIPEGASLTVPEGVTLTNNGTIQKEDGGSFINDGTVTGQQPADSRYTINYAEETITIGEGYEVYTAATDGDKIESNSSITEYIGQTLYLQQTASETTGRTAISIPARPAAPNTSSVSIDYAGEKLSFPPGVTATALEYALSQSDPNWQNVPSDAALSEMGWNGTAIYLYFRTEATDSAFASEATQFPLTIPARPEAPNDLLLMDWTDVSVTYYVGEGVQCRLGNEEAWVTLEQNKTNHTFNNLTPQTTYTIYARKPATESQFASAEASDKVTTKSSAAEPPAMTYEVTANSITLSYSAPWQYQTSDDEWVSVKGEHMFTDLEAAREYTFTVRVAESETAEASKVGTVKVYTAHAAPAANEGYAINYATETLTVKDGYEVNTAEDFTGTAIQSGASLSDYIGSTLYIRHKADANGAPASAAVALTIPARLAAPSGLTAVNETAEGKHDGQITGVTTAMEYKLSTADEWTACTGTTLTNLAPGTYEVRVKGRDSSFTGNAAQVTIATESEPSTPSTPSTPEGPSGPSTGDSSGWDAILDELENAAKGEQITIDMGDETKVPAEIFESLAGKDVEISFDLGDIQWSVSGADIPTDADFTDLDLGVDLDTSGIPVNVINTITGEIGTVQITFAHNGEFGFTMTLTAPLGKENAGYWANLYHYDESAEAMNVEAAARIDQDGSVTIPFSHASQYAIVIDTHSHAAVDVSDIFIDVAPNAWYKDAVQYAYAGGLMTGVSADAFAPEQTTTRAMIVSILARLEGVTSAQAAGFADVSDEWYATAVNWAASAGVVSGTGDGNFSPNAAITREQLAAMLMNYSAWKGEDVSARADLSAYSDQPSTWAEETMSWAVAEGLISGVTNTELQPQGNATRAQVAAILQRFLAQ